MISEIPPTARDKTQSDSLKVSKKSISPPRSANLSLGTTINESTYCFSSTIPSCACFMRFLPSWANGMVTTATVKILMSRAICAKTGIAPVPVPPPIPAVKKIISAPLMTSSIRSLSSNAAWRPISGLAPAPKPLVIPEPS